MEDDVDDRGLRSLGGLDQRALHSLDVVDGVQIAIEQLEKQVTTQGVQSSRPPFVPDHLPHVSCDALTRCHRFPRQKSCRHPKSCFTVESRFCDCKKKTRLPRVMWAPSPSSRAAVVVAPRSFRLH
jgi:hypothetical protein